MTSTNAAVSEVMSTNHHKPSVEMPSQVKILVVAALRISEILQSNVISIETTSNSYQTNYN